MKSKKNIETRKVTSGEKRLDKKHYRILVVLAIVAAAYYYFLKPSTIGHDNRYFIYIFLLPVLTGVIVIAIYRRQFLIHQFSTNKGIVLWSFMFFYYLLQGIVFSYLSVGEVAEISWDYLNHRAAKQNQTETLRCDVTRFWTARTPCSIEFKFNGRYERMITRYSNLKEYIKENPKNYKIEIEAKKGIWNYYEPESWMLVKK